MARILILISLLFMGSHLMAGTGLSFLISNNQQSGLYQSSSLLRHYSSSHDTPRFSLTANYRVFTEYEPLNSSSSLYGYIDESSVSLNARLYSIKGIALRLGAGYKDLDYQISQASSFDYDALRRDFTFFLGVEKHFLVGAFDIYPGFVLPITFVGEDEIQTGSSIINQNIQNGDLVASAGVLLGLNVRLFKVIRLGTEATLTYNEFKQKILANFANTSEIKLQNLNYYVDLTLGIAF